MLMNSFAGSPTVDFFLLLPEMLLAGAAMLLLVLGVFRGNGGTRLVMGLSILVCLLIAALIGMEPAFWTRTVAFSGMFVSDAFSSFLKLSCLIGTAAALAMSQAALRQDMIQRFEYPILVLLSAVGMMLMVSANDFLTVYVGLELQSLSLYILAAFRRETLGSAEAGLKYFILGALSSGFLLFGVSLVYGFTGSTNFDDVAGLLSVDTRPPLGAMIGMVFILAGLAFKVSAAPFHMWTPDVYHGAPGPVAALFAMVPKIAALALLARLLFVPFGALVEDWVQIIAFLALFSMIWGAIAGIVQTNIKRLLAYSSIGNAGYALVGMVTATSEGIAAGIVYLILYLTMTAGTFAALLCLRRDGVMVEEMDDFRGLSKSHPVIAGILALMMFSMSGMPPLAGFIGKYLLFHAAVMEGMYVLVVIGVLTSVLATFYYLKVIRLMYFDTPRETLDCKPDMLQRLVLAGAVAIVLGFILAPGGLVNIAREAALSLALPPEVAGGPSAVLPPPG